eukprot:COSAG01_NODE_54048_length_334_cov_36.672340_1_plen_47_part_10
MTRYGRRLFVDIFFFRVKLGSVVEMTIDRQRSCNSFDVYAMTRYGGG